MFALLLTLTLGAMAQETPQETPDPQTQDPEVQQQEQQNTNRSFTVIPADEWEHHDTALKWINELTPNQTIELTVVVDPADQNSAYFAASAKDDQGGSILSVYHYNTQTQLFERLARRNMASGEAALEWQVIGVDGGRVVFIEQKADTATETCVQPLIRGNDKTDGASLWSIPTDNLVVDPNTQEVYWKETQPAAYSPTQEVLDEARTRQTECEQGQGGGEQQETQPQEGGEQPAPEEQPQGEQSQ